MQIQVMIGGDVNSVDMYTTFEDATTCIKDAFLEYLIFNCKMLHTDDIDEEDKLDVVKMYNDM